MSVTDCLLHVLSISSGQGTVLCCGASGYGSEVTDTEKVCPVVCPSGSVQIGTTIQHVPKSLRTRTYLYG